MLNVRVRKDEEQHKLDVEIQGPVGEIMNDTCNLIRMIYSMLVEEDPASAAYYRTALSQVINGDRVRPPIDSINIVKEGGE